MFLRKGWVLFTKYSKNYKWVIYHQFLLKIAHFVFCALDWLHVIPVNCDSIGNNCVRKES